ncbi:MAG: IS1 family transposase [Planctomycetes bacterium]|nr:IS1 family transposase [Planctomycetota bacterium]
MFAPPFCPNPRCRHHHDRAGWRYQRHGRYRPHCRRFSIQRFQCMSCRRTFSRQTFRADRGDRRPETNVRIFEMLASGVGLRQIARTLGLNPQSVQNKLGKYGLTLGKLHDNLCQRLPAGRTFVLDEEETFEQKSIRPLTVPIVLEAQTWFIVATEVGSIRRLAPEGTARRRRQDRDERLHGRRPDESRRVVQQVLQRLRDRLPEGLLTLRSDQKGSYATLVLEVFGERAQHDTTSSRAPRTSSNQLFAINVTIAMSRDNNGRLRRESWLVTKLAAKLRRQLSIFVAYRNYIRQRFNYDPVSDSPARLLGLLPRALSWREVLRWRQDWGQRSVHPMSRSGLRLVGAAAPCAA